MVHVGKGTVVGNVHDLGEYPALVLTGKRNQRVHGSSSHYQMIRTP